jgi:hypothetical protein
LTEQTVAKCVPPPSSHLNHWNEGRFCPRAAVWQAGGPAELAHLGRNYRAVYRWLTIAGELARGTREPKVDAHFRPECQCRHPHRSCAAACRSGGIRSERSGSRSCDGRPRGAAHRRGIDALIALQGLEDPTERRRQGLRRGRLALDALDELKVGLLGATLSPATLSKLKAAAGALKAGSGDEQLDGLLGEIELRVEVEIAKLTTRAG